MGERGGRLGGDPPTVAQDGHPIGDGQHLVEVVADEEHRGAGGCDAAQGAEQAVDLGPRKGRGGLVEHEQREAAVLAGAVEGAGDTDGRALRFCELGDRASRVDVVAEGVERGDGVASVVTAAQRRERPQPSTEAEVVGHRHRLDEAEVLVDEAQPGGRGGGRRAELERDVGDLGDGTPVGRVVAGEDLHDRRFAGAVLADEGVDLTGGDLEVDRVEGALTRERLGEVPDPQGGRHARRPCAHCSSTSMVTDRYPLSRLPGGSWPALCRTVPPHGDGSNLFLMMNAVNRSS